MRKLYEAAINFLAAGMDIENQLLDKHDLKGFGIILTLDQTKFYGTLERAPHIKIKLQGIGVSSQGFFSLHPVLMVAGYFAIWFKYCSNRKRSSIWLGMTKDTQYRLIIP